MPYPPYTETDWVDDVTLVDEALMDKIEGGIKDNNDAVQDLDTRVATLEDAPAGGGAELVFEGDWAAPTTYDDGDYVVKDGIVFVCVGGPTTTPPDASLWGGPTGIAPSSAVTYGTVFPASPVTGQEHILVDSTTAPSFVWRFRYNAGRGDANKWEFVGGAPYAKFVSAQESTGSGSATDLTTPMSLTAPRAGQYLVEAMSMFWGTLDGGAVIAGISLSVAGATVLDGAWEQRVMARPHTLTWVGAVAAGAVIKPQWRSSNGTVNVRDRSFKVTPLAVA